MAVDGIIANILVSNPSEIICNYHCLEYIQLYLYYANVVNYRYFLS